MSITPHRQRTGQGGFTLIELLVVVLIIGILAAIAIPAFLGQKKKAQDTAAKALIRSGVIAAESYYAENQTFTGLTPALLADQEQNVTWTTPLDPMAQAIRDEIRVTVLTTSTPNDSYVMSTTSKTATIFSYTRDGDGVAFRCSGTAEAAAAGGCVGAYAGGW